MRLLSESTYYSTQKTTIPSNHILNQSPRIEISFDPSKKMFLIQGASDPVNAREFYAEAIAWLVSYAKEPLKYQNLVVQLDYFNTASALFLLRVFKFWHQIDQTNYITWVYDEDDQFLKDSGVEYQDILDERFYLKKLKQFNPTSAKAVAC